MTERPSVDEAVVALISERLVGKKYTSVLFCEFCPGLWFTTESETNALKDVYASWPCFKHYHDGSDGYVYEGDKPKDMVSLTGAS